MDHFKVGPMVRRLRKALLYIQSHLFPNYPRGHFVYKLIVLSFRTILHRTLENRDEAAYGIAMHNKLADIL